MTIDIVTGLPLLKEGQFWRVKTESPGWWDSPVVGNVKIELVERIKIRTRDPRVFLGITFGYGPYYQRNSETVLAYQYLWSSTKVPDNYTGTAIRHEGERFLPVTEDEIQPAWILRAAEKALAEYEGKAKSRALLGDYPPKTLEGIDA